MTGIRDSGGEAEDVTGARDSGDGGGGVGVGGGRVGGGGRGKDGGGGGGGVGGKDGAGGGGGGGGGRNGAGGGGGRYGGDVGGDRDGGGVGGDLNGGDGGGGVGGDLGGGKGGAGGGGYGGGGGGGMDGGGVGRDGGGGGQGAGRGSGGVRAGDELPQLTIPVTRTLIVSGAIASRDYQDVHHDPVASQEKGSPDIFMNILTTNGLVGRYITDHFGSGTILHKVAIRLGAPNYPGDTMVLTGSVEQVDGDTATVRVVGANAIGKHVTGTVTITVPGGASAGGAA